MRRDLVCVLISPVLHSQSQSTQLQRSEKRPWSWRGRLWSCTSAARLEEEVQSFPFSKISPITIKIATGLTLLCAQVMDSNRKCYETDVTRVLQQHRLALQSLLSDNHALRMELETV